MNLIWNFCEIFIKLILCYVYLLELFFCIKKVYILYIIYMEILIYVWIFSYENIDFY